MNILFGAPPYSSLHGPGGVMIQLLKTKEFLEKIGHKVDFFNQWEPLDVNKYDIFHLFYSNLSTSDLVLRIKEMGLKVVISPIIDKSYSNLSIKIANSLLRLCPRIYTHLGSSAFQCKISDSVIVRSDDEFDKVVNAFGIPRAKIGVVPCGVDMKYYKATPDLFRKKYGFYDFVLAVGLIGNPVKNFIRLVHIMGKIGKETVFIGPTHKTTYASEFYRIASKYKNIRILGIISEDELISAYAAANTLVLPSTVEGVGLVALEAGLAGAKVVITKNGGPPSYFDDLVEYVDPYNEEDIEKKILRSLSRSKDDRLRLHIKESYSWEVVAKKQAEIYLKVLNET